MIPTVRFGRTGLTVTRLALGGYPFGGVNRARGWDPFTPEGRATAVRTIHAALDAGISYFQSHDGRNAVGPPRHQLFLEYGPDVLQRGHHVSVFSGDSDGGCSGI